MDDWNRQFFTHTGVQHTLKGTDRALSDEAPLLKLPAPTLSLQKDTLENGMRKVYLHCQAREDALSARILFSDSCPVYTIMVDGKEWPRAVDRKSEYHSFNYKGLAKEGFDLILAISPKSPLDCWLTDRSLGLPEVKGFNTAYPADIIPGPGYNSNTIQVVKHYRFKW
jgi:hypothetical protein